MKIDNKYKEVLVELMDNYKMIHAEINIIETEIEILKKSWDFLSKQLETSRLVEDQFNKIFIEAYGAGTLNIETWEWEQE
jgi:hypothetical protein